MGARAPLSHSDSHPSRFRLLDQLWAPLVVWQPHVVEAAGSFSKGDCWFRLWLCLSLIVSFSLQRLCLAAPSSTSRCAILVSVEMLEVPSRRTLTNRCLH